MLVVRDVDPSDSSHALPLSLLVLGFLVADHPDHATTLDDLATPAHLLDASAYFHAIHLTPGTIAGPRPDSIAPAVSCTDSP